MHIPLSWWVLPNVFIWMVLVNPYSSKQKSAIVSLNSKFVNCSKVLTSNSHIASFSPWEIWVYQWFSCIWASTFLNLWYIWVHMYTGYTTYLNRRFLHLQDTHFASSSSDDNFIKNAYTLKIIFLLHRHKTSLLFLIASVGSFIISTGTTTCKQH
jgi:hypothetical protein